MNYDFDREEWLYASTPPITGPAWNSLNITYFNIHYTGASSGYAGKSEQAALNSIQRDYQLNRGYSFGYSCAVGLSGATYEGRGTDFRAASNGTDTVYGDDALPGNPKIKDNLEVFSCLLIVGVPDDITFPMIQGVQKLYAGICAVTGRELTINGHKDMGQTACPGVKAYALIKSGAFYPKPVPIPDGDDDLKVLPKPLRVFDTRNTDYTINGMKVTSRAPVGPGQFTFYIMGQGTETEEVEATVTAIPQKAEAGYLGVDKDDSFINWTSSQKGVPIPQTVRLKISNGGCPLFISGNVHLIFSIRAK
jgi:hypothetical protein